YARLQGMGEAGFLSTFAGYLAHALYALGEYEEALQFSRLSEGAASPDDVASQMLWRSARAKLLARHGDLDRAETLAREAVVLGERTDLLNTQADALSDLAEALVLAGRPEDALAALEEAAQRYEQKGNLPSLERARDDARRLA